MFEWNNSMKTGLSSIDDQHRELISKFNELADAEANGAGNEKVDEILDFLQFYADWHFGREEELMEEYQCPILDENKKAHAEYRSKFGKLYGLWHDSAKTDGTVIHDTIIELARWIVNHILTIDNQLFKYVDKPNQ
jgi:hemerythrin